MNIPRSGEIIVNRNSGCTGEEYLLDFSVERNFGFKSPVEFDTTIVAVPQLSDVGDPANKAQSPVRKDTDLTAVPAVGQQLVTPGTEPDSAPNVPPTFRSEIVIGETQYVKIPAGWGQNLNFELSVVDEGRVDDQLFEDAVKEFEFALLNPARESVDLIGATTSDVTDVNKPVRFGTARAVSFANADQPNPAWLAGDHYLAVTLARNIGDNTDEKTLSVPVRYQISLPRLVSLSPVRSSQISRCRKKAYRRPSPQRPLHRPTPPRTPMCHPLAQPHALLSALRLWGLLSF